jgi:hypothetical protein
MTAHQRIGIRRAFPDARVDGDVVRVGRWTLILAGGRLDLPMARGPAGWETDASDEAMEIWPRLREALGCG